LPDINGVEDMEQVNEEYSLSFVCFNTKNNQYAYPLYAEPIKDDQYTTAESLTERLKQELVDVPEPHQSMLRTEGYTD
ncbi:hypothetical protein, partial [Streptomyces sp. GSL17-113]|uniref:hypothetical protein n=1 Tax=Streptomyces sp. GSL17-113 TaxID=3115365 RepID=UPI002E799C9F